ncbi:SDR family oxidoreductase [Saccharolobus solfataricus]|uniref:3-oxoacyl-(Acyl carrier protein) reductase (FabG-8) n=3 Tax=Saccharolobus solfataricus TaxID=2287 RepID=Q97VG2_SACS2|nr:SDR family oxidoreductase [Saccharolobus solfataricus]AAK42782.1 3-oxoacyl-(acyl carrier protein) reductase (fabG-8) [Saccharolobus solfataricus P2]AKA72873.1 SDR family oxidoreductase [Saccharolobus solfataricus]AKA75572.1 SDR family oxidoreductase [Saccharolobus solfataricus]AKA78265.1 SDR family oxidoreductase [Saccharolobus solfataricus]AZF67383.1 SDR family oxidoreductase [Saccharolobus solfataricus]
MIKLDLSGKVCLITGGTSGIGLKTAELFSKLGANVYVIGRREANFLSKNIYFKKVDLTRREDVLSFIEWYEKNVGTIHVLINNASQNSRYSVLDIPIKEWDEMISLNLTAPFLLSRMAAKLMIKRGIKGKIINISAIQSKFPLERSFAYVTTKGGLISMGRSLAVDLGKYGIQVITVLPGPIYSKDDEPPASLDKRAATLLGRMGRMIEISHLLAFLASDLNSFITGTEIIIDGGRIISRKPDPEEITKGEI